MYEAGALTEAELTAKFNLSAPPDDILVLNDEMFPTADNLVALSSMAPEPAVALTRLVRLSPSRSKR